jgi:hypothetical protein
MKTLWEYHMLYDLIPTLNVTWIISKSMGLEMIIYLLNEAPFFDVFKSLDVYQEDYYF